MSKKTSQYKSVKSEAFRSDCICIKIHFQCLRIMLTQKDDRDLSALSYLITLKVKRTPKCSQKAMLQMLILQGANNTQSSVGANLVEMEPAVDFPTAVLFGWEKSHVLCKNNSRFSELILNDGLSKTPIGALPYWTVWVNERSPFVVS